MAILRAARYLHMVMLLVPVAKVPAWSFHSSVLSTWGSEMPPVVSIMAIFFLAASVPQLLTLTSLWMLPY